MVVLSLAMKWCGSCVVSSAVFYAFVPSHTSQKKINRRFEWAVRCTETIQACVMCLGSSAWLLRQSKMAHDTAWTPFAAVYEDFDSLGWLPSLMEIMCGYLVFDTAYEVVRPFVDHDAPDVAFILHHVVGIASHAATLRHEHVVVAGYAPYIYLAEWSTPFLHASWMLNALDRTDGLLFLVNGSVGAAMYLVFRVVLPPAILLHLACVNAKSS